MNYLYPLLAMLIWSINAIVNKLSATVIDPAAISFYRWLVALLVLTPFMLKPTLKNWQNITPHLLKLTLLGLLGMALYQSLAYYAAHTISALFMGIINSLIPLVTILLSVLVMRVIPTLNVIIGGLLSFCGLIWLISGGNPVILFTTGIGIGEMLMLIAVLCYALYGVLTNRWQLPIPIWQSLYVQILLTTCMLLPNFLLAEDQTLTTDNIYLVLFAGIPASILATYFWLQGIARLGANKTAVFFNLMPVFTALLAIFWLHESLHTYHIIGGGIALLGVITAQRQFKLKPSSTPPKQ